MNTLKKFVLSAVGLSLGLSLSAQAQSKPAIVFDMGGKFDRSFNQSAYEGAERYKAETGKGYAEFEITNPVQRKQAQLRFAQRGYHPIVLIGFAHQPILEEVAPKFPDTDFAIIDAVTTGDNVRSIIFKEHEGSFLAGALAAMKSQTGKVGFVGGMDIPLIRKFACGYEQGAKYVNPEISVFQNMTGTTPEAWNDPSTGGELAKSQFDRGADIVFAAAGQTGLGVYQAAKDAGKFAIGVDSNQNYLHPGTMLTSVVKAVDLAVYSVFKDGEGDDFSTGVRELGLAENGVSLAFDEYNEDLISAEEKEKIAEIKKKIVEGEVTVHNYFDTQSCELPAK